MFELLRLYLAYYQTEYRNMQCLECLKCKLPDCNLSYSFILLIWISVFKNTFETFARESRHSK